MSDADDCNPLPKYVEGENWDGLSDHGDAFYISQDIDRLRGDRWKIILMALNLQKESSAI
jgi:hypothetical protein